MRWSPGCTACTKPTRRNDHGPYAQTALLERFLGKFPADPNHDRLAQAIAAGDREGALTAAHTMKGVCGNLSMTALFELLTRQVAAFRADDWDGAVAMMPELDRMYDGLCAAIAS